VTTAAILLIFSSAGFGAHFAFTQGIHHSPALGVFAVAMALGLEFAKPYAVENAIACFGQMVFGRAFAMTVLAGVAILYSLAAELSLMATTRGDAVAERAAYADLAQKARDRYARAENELAALAPSRPAAEVQGLIDGVLLNPKAGNCASTNGPYTREWCPKVAGWRSELGRANQRAKLEATMAEAEADTKAVHAVKSPDPGAAALSTYLGMFGLSIPAAVLSEWIVLVGVVALEVGAALSVVLVQSTSVPKGSVQQDVMAEAKPVVDGSLPATLPATPTIDLPAAPSKNDDFTEENALAGSLPSTSANGARDRLLHMLSGGQGVVRGCQAELGRALGVSRTRVRQLLSELVAAGAIKVRSSSTGTTISLVAGGKA
jgi:hypothetical protein